MLREIVMLVYGCTNTRINRGSNRSDNLLLYLRQIPGC